jgi:hypothetical protein
MFAKVNEGASNNVQMGGDMTPATLASMPTENFHDERVAMIEKRIKANGGGSRKAPTQQDFYKSQDNYDIGSEDFRNEVGADFLSSPGQS